MMTQTKKICKFVGKVVLMGFKVIVQQNDAPDRFHYVDLLVFGKIIVYEARIAKKTHIGVVFFIPFSQQGINFLPGDPKICHKCCNQMLFFLVTALTVCVGGFKQQYGQCQMGG